MAVFAQYCDPGTPEARFVRIPLGDKNDPTIQVHAGVAYSPSGAVLYDATGDSGAIDIFSTTDWRHIARISLDGVTAGRNFASSFASSLILSADGRVIYVIDEANRRVVVIETSTRKRVASVPTGVGPFAIALSPDGRHLYVTNSGLFEYKLIDGLDKNNPIGTGLRFPPFGYPSKDARKGTLVGGHTIPGLGDENDPRGSSLWTYDLSNPSVPRLEHRLRLGAPIRERRDGVVGGASPTGVVASDDHVYVALSHEDEIAEVAAYGKKVEARIALSPFDGPEFVDREGRPLRGVSPQGLALRGDRL